MAFMLYEDTTQRLAICASLRETGKQHESLPLKPLKEKRCTDEKCHCKPHYILLDGMEGGIGDGKSTFVSMPRALALSSAHPCAPTNLFVRSACGLSQVEDLFSSWRSQERKKRTE